MPLTRSDLLHSAESFCSSFASKKPLHIVLSHFSTTHRITCIEYGLPSLAPFLGRPFEDPKAYFTLVSQLLTYNNMQFSEYMVDTEARKVNVKGTGTFTWLQTNQSWDEVFTSVLDFDEDAKITGYQVWADSGACYLAKEGMLDNVQSPVVGID